MKALRQPQMIEGVDAVGAAHGSKTGRGQAAGEDLRRGLAHPLQAGLARAVVKAQHQQNARPDTCGVANVTGSLRGRRDRHQKHERNSRHHEPVRPKKAS